MSKDNDDSDYEVGYGKPPKSGRFKKGQSGNPKGRPKGQTAKEEPNFWRWTDHDFRELFMQAMEKPVMVTEYDRPVAKPFIEAITDTVKYRAVKGDFRSAKFLVETYASILKEHTRAKLELVDHLTDFEICLEAKIKNDPSDPKIPEMQDFLERVRKRYGDYRPKT